jgi:hypothetical protein
MSIGAEELTKYGNVHVYVANNGILDGTWTLSGLSS